MEREKTYWERLSEGKMKGSLIRCSGQVKQLQENQQLQQPVKKNSLVNEKYFLATYMQDGEIDVRLSKAETIATLLCCSLVARL